MSAIISKRVSLLMWNGDDLHERRPRYPTYLYGAAEPLSPSAAMNLSVSMLNPACRITPFGSIAANQGVPPVQ